MSVETRRQDLQPKLEPHRENSAGRDYTNKAIDRIRRQFSEKAILPSQSDDSQETLDLQRLQRLYNSVFTEGYGEPGPGDPDYKG